VCFDVGRGWGYSGTGLLERVVIAGDYYIRSLSVYVCICGKISGENTGTSSFSACLF
jgi:hypothetical protein